MYTSYIRRQPRKKYKSLIKKTLKVFLKNFFILRVFGKLVRFKDAGFGNDEVSTPRHIGFKPIALH